MLIIFHEYVIKPRKFRFSEDTLRIFSQELVTNFDKENLHM